MGDPRATPRGQSTWTPVCHNEHGELVPVLNSEYLFVEFVYFLVRASVRKGEDKEETLARPHVLFPHGAKLFLTRGVKNVELRHGVIDDALLGVGVLDGGVIVSDEVTLNKLNCDC